MRCTRVIFKRHAIKRMGQWGIRSGDVMKALASSFVIEDYPDDPRGHSCLALGVIEDRPVHMCVGIAHAPDYCDVITVYRPDPEEWDSDYRKRRGRTS